MVPVEGPSSEPPLDPFFVAPRPDDRSSHAQRQLIGALGLALPALVYAVARWRPIDELPDGALLGSISAYYYTSAIVVFVGILVALGVFLITYKGYDNADHGRDRTTAVIAGTAALLVALFPTAAPDPDLHLPWWTAATGWIHYGAAVTLFVCFAYFSLVLFRKSKRGEPATEEKRLRNGIFLTCGIVILLGMAWTVVAKLLEQPIFLPETVMLVAFAVSWLAKGHFEATAIAAAQRAARGGRHGLEFLRRLVSTLVP